MEIHGLGREDEAQLLTTGILHGIGQVYPVLTLIADEFYRPAVDLHMYAGLIFVNS